MTALQGIISREMGHKFRETMLKSRTVILVIDEIDLLVSKWDGKELSVSEEFLQTVLEWASDLTKRFAVIGMSNSVENRKGRRLHKLGRVSFILTWQIKLVSFFKERSSHVSPSFLSFISNLCFNHME